jgi:NAD(P)-dependent dehydrogenase (short-subunit alcohol dehydrogenase family)
VVSVDASALPIVVTGVASGIGAAVALRLRDAGREVVGVDRDAGGPLGDAVIPTDIGDSESVDALAAELARRAPDGIGALVNVAGISSTRSPESILRVNLFGTRRVIERLAPHVVRGGTIVNIASTTAEGWQSQRHEVAAVALDPDPIAATARAVATPEIFENAYAFSKRGIRLLTEWWAVELLPAGVRVVSVSPGPVDTPLLAEQVDSGGGAIPKVAAQMVGRWGEPEDIAGVVMVALAPDAAWLNGTDLRADGGLSAVRGRDALG